MPSSVEAVFGSVPNWRARLPPRRVSRTVALERDPPDGISGHYAVFCCAAMHWQSQRLPFPAMKYFGRPNDAHLLCRDALAEPTTLVWCAEILWQSQRPSFSEPEYFGRANDARLEDKNVRSVIRVAVLDGVSHPADF